MYGLHSGVKNFKLQERQLCQQAPVVPEGLSTVA